MEKLLFTEGDLRSALQFTARKVAKRLADWDPDDLLNAPVVDVVDELVEGGTVRCPRLLRDQASMPPPTEVTANINTVSGIYERRVTRLVLVVPFDGEQVVFTLRPNTFGFNPPALLG